MKTCTIIFFFLMLLKPLHLEAQQKLPGIPPAKVVVSNVTSGFIAPEGEFTGTVFYQEVSDVASEVSGLAEEVSFEEGQRVKKGDVLVVISSDLLEKTIQSAKAKYEQVLPDLENERKYLERAESLFREQLLSEQSYDEQRFKITGLEKQALSLKAEVERLDVELSKKAVKSPFDGIVIKRHIETGEWLSPGTAVAAIGKDDYADVIAEVPENVLAYVKKGMNARVITGGRELTGKVFSIVPRGNVTTRTIPVKVRIRNTTGLIEGMEARLILPSGRKEKAMIVHRDAVITVFGNKVVFVASDSKAKMIPVKVAGYTGMNAGVHGEGLREGMKVVIKGNERLRDGQPVSVQQ